MTLKDKLDIILVTYNRKNDLENTFNQIFSNNSPIKDFNITVLNNNSNDGTEELINTYAEKYSNLKHIKNKINIGGNANITKAFAEIANKKYVWVICDNDFYNWNSWAEVEGAIELEYDVILLRNCEKNISNYFHEANFVPACIYKRENITSTVVENMYDNIRFLFPHLAIMAKNINDKNKFFVVSKNIVEIGVNSNLKTTYNKDRNLKDVPKSRKMMFWSVGFFNSLELVTDRKKQVEIIENLTHFHKNLFEFFKTIIIYNQLFEEDYFYNLEQIYRTLSFMQKLKFIVAYFIVKTSFKNYKYWFIRTEEEWKEYLREIKEQKYINKLSKRLKNKKVLLYGAGVLGKILLENYDFSAFDIVGISDKKFEETSGEKFYNYKIIKPENILNIDYDVILFTLKEYKHIEKNFKNKGIDKKFYSLIENNNKYALRF